MGFDRNETDYGLMEESDLVRLASNGDKIAFGEIYERYITKIYNYIYYRTSNEQDAEDLTARVFMRAMKHIEKYDDRGVPFSAWLYRIAHNLVANWHRDNSRRKIIALDDYITSNTPDDAPEDIAAFNEQKDELLETVRDLPEDRQQLLLLKFVDRLPNAEIGDIMDRTEGAIKSLYHRTLAALHEELSDREVVPPRARGNRGRKNN